MFGEILTLNSTDADFKVRLLHVFVSSSERLSAHIVPESDTMATFMTSARNKANAFSSKKNTDASCKKITKIISAGLFYFQKSWQFVHFTSLAFYGLLQKILFQMLHVS